MKLYVIIAYMKNGAKNYFNCDYSSGGYGYTSLHPDVFVESEHETFFDVWKDNVGKTYNSDVERIEKRYFDFLS